MLLRTCPRGETGDAFTGPASGEQSSLRTQTQDISSARSRVRGKREGLGYFLEEDEAFDTCGFSFSPR
jgi:hypothetical protein